MKSVRTKPGAKRSEAQREKDLIDLERMTLHCWTQQKMTDWFNENRPYTLTRQTIINDQKVILERWRAEVMDYAKQAKEIELKKLANLEAEYRAGYERSLRDEQKMTQEKTDTPGARGRGKTTTKAIVTKAARDGSPVWLEGIIKCIEKRCKLLGIDAPDRTEITGAGGGPIPLDLGKAVQVYIPAKKTLPDG